MKKVRIEDWSPAGKLNLEETALKVISSKKNFLVVAGPGAGKTELLAQKACFLLQSNECKYPQRILAISFKRDAAYNLKERVRLRCEEVLSNRFDSMTFDSFAKLILDHFGNSLPQSLNIDKDYLILLDDKSVLEYYEKLDRTFRFSKTDKELISFHTTSKVGLDSHSNAISIRNAVWESMMKDKPSKLTFKMIMRLAEAIMTGNEKIKLFLQNTYSHIFLDEFQDATAIQYEFFKSCFLGGNSQITAVGDDKQRIMLWAGAQESVFEDYLLELSAEKAHLKMNFRCAPRLVALQNYLTEHLLGKTDFSTPDPKRHKEGGECFLWVFKNPDQEITTLFSTVYKLINEDKIKPREICILVKQSLNIYAGDLIDHFNEHGINARDESILQDLIAQDLSQYIIHSLYVIFDKRWKDSKTIALTFLNNLHTDLEQSQLLKSEISFSKFIKQCQQKYNDVYWNAERLGAVINEIIDFAGRDKIQYFYPMYKSVKFLDETLADIIRELTNLYNEDLGLIQALESLIGIETVPVMTVHKSKGLEYHTIIFVGLEDGAFWSYQKQPDEDKCAFFVALSRAKHRVIFTFSKTRKDRNGRIRNQSFKVIEDIFNELKNSGLVITEEK
ncbi:Superfamily I DNA or RNA helicase [Dyadobacter koreensis]|uniref:DNA 3'-5' helicase n=1 Tax=Dyadobacter koreensis TaxID=408657 RepID=A0A1H6VGC7_9BACT|nr:ATP-dependent helicase [Dyadobacter koreensis]SEJ03641.1 Superfamily I DNA or RNA helicase [Dyadobacter koreensis]